MSGGCGNEHESFQGPCVVSMEKGWDEVGRKTTTTTRRGESEDGPEGSVIEDDQDG